MSAIEKPHQTRTMSYALRPLESRDIPQADEIERDAFPTLFPTTSFRREMKNRLARYLVAWRKDDEQETPRNDDLAEIQERTPLSVSRLLANARTVWGRRRTIWEPGQQHIVGVLGVWYMVDEAHIVTVGVRTEYRGQGIGELQVIGAIEQAMEKSMRAVTLEVRVSNDIAQNLYEKYGFKQRGVRKGYYTDNREDAYIMTTDSIQTSEYSRRFHELVQLHEVRWGQSERILF